LCHASTTEPSLGAKTLVTFIIAINSNVFTTAKYMLVIILVFINHHGHAGKIQGPIPNSKIDPIALTWAVNIKKYFQQ
jgi:hypothetical protein